MPIILRIDVDNPYGWDSLYRKILNYFALNYRRLPIKRRALGYLDHAMDLFQTLELQIPFS